MFPNLSAEMARQGLTMKTLAKSLEMTYDTIRNKMNGRTEFTRVEMFNIKKIFFSGLSIDYLFSSDELPNEKAD